MIASFFFPFFLAASILLLGPTPKEVVEAYYTCESEWQKLLHDSIEISFTIQNPVERNKMLQFLNSLQQKSQQELSKDISETNYFLAEKQRLEWKEINLKLKNRLNSAQQNLIDGQDKFLIVKILQELSRVASQQVSTSQQENIADKKIEPWNSVEYVRNVYVDEWLGYNLAEVKKQLGDFSPTVFISYAWGPIEKSFVHQLADHLSEAGINVRLDKWHNGLSTGIHTQFVTELESVDYIIVVGSQLYGDKCKQNKNNVVITEARIIAERHKRQPGRILPILLSGNPKDAFPAFLRDKVFANFEDPKDYSQQLSFLILSICKYANNYSEINQTLQTMVEGAERLQNLSPDGLVKQF